MIIRKTKPEDAEAISRLHRQTIKRVNSKDYSREQVEVWSKRSTPGWIKKIITNPDVYYYVAVEKNNIVGFGDFSREDGLRGLYIASDWINKGVGRKLVQKIEREARKLGIKELKLKSTLTAYEFYKKMGFTKTKRGRHTIGKQKLDIYHMKKKL